MAALAELKVPEPAEGARVDRFVGEALGLSRSRLRELFEAGAIRVDGKRAPKGQPLRAGQVVRVEQEEALEAMVPEPDAPLVVLRADEALVFVDKPAGVPVHPLKPGEVGTVANALVGRFPECAGASEDPREGGLCHRLDTGTSGVLLAARTREAWEAVREAFGLQQVDKRYLALVSGPLADEGEIDLPLRHKGDHVEAAAEGGAGTRPAQTTFRVLGRKGSHALVEVRIHTGVLHQVRAHLAAIGAPLVGDPQYDGPEAPDLGRFFLHARSLELRHPVSGERVRVESPLPDDLKRALAVRGLGAPEGAGR